MGQLHCTFTKQSRLGKIFVTATDDTGTSNKTIVVAGGFSNERRYSLHRVTSTQKSWRHGMKTLILEWCFIASSIVVASRGTDVLVLLLADYSKDQDWGLTSAPFRR